MVMGDTRLCPFDAGTFGSRTTPDMAQRLRRVAAAARELLVDLAAEEWKADRAALTVAAGKVVHKETKAELSFGKLTKGEKITKAVAENPPTTPAAQWKVAGQSPTKINGSDFVTGRHKYSSDVALPGMLHGKVLRAPAFGAKLASADTREAEAMPGVVVIHDESFIGVAAPTEFLAAKALKAIKADWTTSPQVSAKELFAQLQKPAGEAR